jgi:hypothetical protein
MWWAEPDLNRRPLARKANVLTRLDDRPPANLTVRLDLKVLERKWRTLILEFCFLARTIGAWRLFEFARHEFLEQVDEDWDVYDDADGVYPDLIVNQNPHAGTCRVG